MGTAEVTVAIDAHAELGEGPVWDPRAGCLYFVDILRGHVHRFDPASAARRTYDVHEPVGAAALTESDDLVLAVRGGFARLDLETGAMRMVAPVEADVPGNRMNDGKCDPAGRFWAGTMSLEERAGAGALYRLDRDGRVHTMLTGVTISNGLDWTGDGRHMYYIDSGARSVDVFDYDADSGAIANRRVLVRIDGRDVVPDGMTLDADGCLWVALWGGGAVHRYTPAGRLDATIAVPATLVTSCAFGGPDLADFYITTATVALSDRERAEQPQAGAVFVARPGINGRPANRFNG